MAHIEDVNEDNVPDMVIQVETKNIDPNVLQHGYATLTGGTNNNQNIYGIDMVAIVPE